MSKKELELVKLIRKAKSKERLDKNEAGLLKNAKKLLDMIKRAELEKKTEKLDKDKKQLEIGDRVNMNKMTRVLNTEEMDKPKLLNENKSREELELIQLIKKAKLLSMIKKAQLMNKMTKAEKLEENKKQLEARGKVDMDRLAIELTTNKMGQPMLREMEEMYRFKLAR